jgi:AcrR family transcriptional regulator
VDQPLLPWGAPRPERADAVRNRLHLLAVARDMLAEQGADKLTMDGLAERAGLGKGTVFRRFGTRAGIFQALLDEEERAFQEQVLSGPPPLGPGAPPLDRLIAYGRARASFMVSRHEIARAALDGNQPRPAGAHTPISQVHIRMLLGQMDLGPTDLGPTDLDLLAVQLTAALDGPLLLYLSGPDLAGPDVAERVARSWEDLIRRVTRRWALRVLCLPWRFRGIPETRVAHSGDTASGGRRDVGCGLSDGRSTNS